VTQGLPASRLHAARARAAGRCRLCSRRAPAAARHSPLTPSLGTVSKGHTASMRSAACGAACPQAACPRHEGRNTGNAGKPACSMATKISTCRGWPGVPTRTSRLSGTRPRLVHAALLRCDWRAGVTAGESTEGVSGCNAASMSAAPSATPGLACERAALLKVNDSQLPRACSQHRRHRHLQHVAPLEETFAGHLLGSK